MEQVVVNNLEELLQAIGKRKNSEGRIFLLFCGDTDKETGQSWCSDCVKANPVIDEVLKELDCVGDVLIRCTVGDRQMWKDPENVFRKHPKLELNGVPTLMEWGTQKRLGDEDCRRGDLVRLLFQKEDN